MSQQSQRQVPKFPVVRFQQVFAGIDLVSVLLGGAIGAAGLYAILKFGMKKRCI